MITEKKDRAKTDLSGHKKHVDLYTDGACRGNPGKGGYGAILVYGKYEKVISEGFVLTTNNRMELLAVIKGLEALKTKCDVKIVSDSKYVVDSLSKGWVDSWRVKNWKKSDGKKALNVDLWERYYRAAEGHVISFEWVKGHEGHPYNERCDKLAVASAEAA